MRAGHNIISLSLGNVAEPSAAVVVHPRTEHSQPDEDGRRTSQNRFAVSWLERFPAGRPLPAIVARAVELVSLKQMTNNYTLLLDITSTGGAPVREFEHRSIYPSTYDFAGTVVEEQTGPGPKRVPLRDVIGASQVVLQTGRVEVSSDLNLAETLVNDLTAFDPKAVTRDMDLRGGRNADLVLALALALWWGDQYTYGGGKRGFDGPLPLDHSWMYA